MHARTSVRTHACAHARTHTDGCEHSRVNAGLGSAVGADEVEVGAAPPRPHADRDGVQRSAPSRLRCAVCTEACSGPDRDVRHSHCRQRVHNQPRMARVAAVATSAERSCLQHAAMPLHQDQPCYNIAGTQNVSVYGSAASLCAAIVLTRMSDVSAACPCVCSPSTSKPSQQ